jgi:3-oxoadipate enol-lactonase
MGGFVGMRIAARRPELLRSLTLIETAADAEPRWNVPKYRAMAFVGRRVGLGPLVPAVMRIMFGRSFLRDPARADERARLRDELRALDMRRVEPALEAVVRRRPILDELARIRTPTLVLHGTEDRAIVPARAERTARAIAGARYVPVPRGGHTVSLEEPEAISRAIAAFVDGA